MGLGSWWVSLGVSLLVVSSWAHVPVFFGAGWCEALLRRATKEYSRVPLCCGTLLYSSRDTLSVSISVPVGLYLGLWTLYPGLPGDLRYRYL